LISAGVGATFNVMATAKSRRVEGLRQAHFPEVPTFDQRLGGYSAVPWVYRTILAAFSPREWMVLSYLYLRSGPEGITWLTDETIGRDIGLGRKKLGPHVRRLAELGFIVTKRIGRQRFIKLVNPMALVDGLLQPRSFLAPEQRERLQQDLEQIERARRSRARDLYEVGMME
jgi:DNA-binding MarR family transcriptional regulator